MNESTVEMAGRLAVMFTRAAAALERSADLAEQHGRHEQRRGRLEAAARERAIARRARVAAERARSHSAVSWRRRAADAGALETISLEPAGAAERRSSRAELVVSTGLAEVVGCAVEDLAEHDESVEVQPLGIAGDQSPDL